MRIGFVMNNAMQFDAVGAIVHVWGMASAFVREAVVDVLASRMSESVGTIVNHPAWTLSHLNAYAGTLLTFVDDAGAIDVEGEMARYGYGTTPVKDASAYLPKDELLGVFDERCERVAATVAQRHAAYFSRPAPAMYQPHARVIGDVATILMTTHLGYHLGQLRQWRKAAGMA